MRMPEGTNLVSITKVSEESTDESLAEEIIEEQEANDTNEKE